MAARIGIVILGLDKELNTGNCKGLLPATIYLTTQSCLNNLLCVPNTNYWALLSLLNIVKHKELTRQSHAWIHSFRLLCWMLGSGADDAVQLYVTGIYTTSTSPEHR